MPPRVRKAGPTATPRKPRVPIGTDKNGAPKRLTDQAQESLKGDLLKLSDLKSDIASLQDEAAAIADRITDAMSTFEIKTLKATDREGHTHTATWVQSKTPIIDQNLLKTKLGSVLWAKVTTKVLDSKKLAAFVASNEIDANVVAECTEDKLSKPHVRITKK